MKHLTYIVLLLVANLALGQSFLNKEQNWLLDSKLPLEDYKYDFQYYHDSTFNAVRKNMLLEIAPHVEGGIQSSKGVIKAGLNLNFYGTYKYLLDGFVAYNGGYINSPNVIYHSPLQAKSFFLFNHGSSNYSYHDLRTRISYKPNKYIQFQAGIDKHKIGEGDRSLLLGDQGIANPFAMLKVNFWKLEYINLQQIWRDGASFHYVPKGNASHYINFKASKKFSFGIFESVTHLIKDTLYNRGYDVEYLNPLIFYRPQEYSLGSSDNVILGINSHYTFKNTMVYGQFILDEFLLSNLRARNRWWANKYGGQIGVKSFLKLNKMTVFWRSELNIVRPYTYSHNKAGLSYSNQGQTVAHPLGSNFIEWYNQAQFTIKKNNIHIWVQYYLKGNDSLTSNTSYGGDIYKSYILKPSWQDTLFYIGSGTKINCFQLGIYYSRFITKFRWECFIEPRIKIQTQDGKLASQFYAFIGIRSRLFNDNRNY